MGSDNEIRSALGSLPPDLFSSYERLLLEINKKPPENRSLVQRALKWIMWEGGIKIEALQEALSVHQEMRNLSEASLVREERILQLCGSLIRKDTRGTHLEPAHFSVKEFLLSLGQNQESRRAAYGLNRSVDFKYFAIVAGNYLSCEDFANPPGIRDFPLLACEVEQGCYVYRQYAFRGIARTNLVRWA